MKEKTSVKNHGGNVLVTVVPTQVLIDRMNEMRGMIARRAYELFEGRGRVHGRNVDDWLQAESELLHSCRDHLKDSGEAIILHAEMPGSFTADQLKVSVEPRRVRVSGEREVEVLHGDSEGTHMRNEAQRILRVHELPVDVDPSRATATLKDEALEVVMPKIATPAKARDKAKATSPGK
jgi:HSP20 family molecular chaperone IbpA